MGTRQFVTFRLNDQLLGMDIALIREINRVLDITPVHNVREHITGLVNLRGQIVVIFDLGIRLGMGSQEVTDDSHSVVLKQEDVAFLVDSIGDVVTAEENDIEPPPANLSGIASDYLESVVKLDQEIMAVLAVDKILA
jgi:purine-binding chemotaxis protein CheW